MGNICRYVRNNLTGNNAARNCLFESITLSLFLQTFTFIASCFLFSHKTFFLFKLCQKQSIFSKVKIHCRTWTPKPPLEKVLPTYIGTISNRAAELVIKGARKDWRSHFLLVLSLHCQSLPPASPSCTPCGRVWRRQILLMVGED